MPRLVALLALLCTCRLAVAETADDVLVEWDRAEAARVRLRASLAPLLLVPAGDPTLLQAGHQGTATAVAGPKGPRLVTAASLLTGDPRPWVVLAEDRRVPARVVRTDGVVAVLAVEEWPPGLVPAPLAPEAAAGAMLIVSNVWTFGHEVLSRADLMEELDDPVLGPVWLTGAVVPDGTPLFTADGALAAVPFLRYGERRTLAAGARRVAKLLEERGRDRAPEEPARRR